MTYFKSYTAGMTAYLMRNGFRYIDIIDNKMKENSKIYLFELTNELQDSVNKYLEMFKK